MDYQDQGDYGKAQSQTAARNIAFDAQNRISQQMGGAIQAGPKVLTCTDKAERVLSQAKELAEVMASIRSKLAGSYPEAEGKLNPLKNPIPSCLDELLGSCLHELDEVIAHARFVGSRL